MSTAEKSQLHRKASQGKGPRRGRWNRRRLARAGIAVFGAGVLAALASEEDTERESSAAILGGSVVFRFGASGIRTLRCQADA